MNIFILDKNPEKCASYHCDKHVVKMILESAQLLCTACNLNGLKAPYKSTHNNHPCAIWVRESSSNYDFLCSLGIALCKEYTKRYEKKHKTEKVIEWCIKNKPELPKIGLTEFVQAMPEKYKTNDVVKAYRAYYLCEKKDILNYTNCKKPDFLI